MQRSLQQPILSIIFFLFCACPSSQEERSLLLPQEELFLSQLLLQDWYLRCFRDCNSALYPLQGLRRRRFHRRGRDPPRPRRRCRRWEYPRRSRLYIRFLLSESQAIPPRFPRSRSQPQSHKRKDRPLPQGIQAIPPRFRQSRFQPQFHKRIFRPYPLRIQATLPAFLCSPPLPQGRRRIFRCLKQHL